MPEDIEPQIEEAERRIAEYVRRRRKGGLDLGNLGLEQVPSLLRKAKVERLNLQRNRLETLPPWFGEIRELHTLDLLGNPLKSLPESMMKLGLRLLRVTNCPGLGIPKSLAEGYDARKILSYYFESREGKGLPLRELKLLLVGRGKAGKTTIVKQLAGEAPDKEESETHSISIREFPLPCTKGTVQTRAWDFGGQEILHSTHQFFLTERSLYLLVLEPRTGLAQRDAEYWLKLIETQGGGSPVIVVLNHSHKRHWRVDEVKLRRKFPFITDFIATDALYGDGVEELRSRIVRVVEEKLPDVWLPFPKRWREIKDAVSRMQQNFLTYQEYVKLCAENGEVDSQ